MGVVAESTLPAPGDEPPRRPVRRDLISSAVRHLADQKPIIIVLAGLSIVAAQIESVALVSIALIADTAVSGKATADLEVGPLSVGLPTAVAGALTAGAIVAAAGVVFAYGRLWAKRFARIERDSRNLIVSSFAAGDWEYQAGQLSSRVQGRVLRLMDARAVAFTGLVHWIRALATILVFVAIAAAMSPLAAAVIMVFGALLSLVVLPVRRRLVQSNAVSAEREVGLVADVAEAADHGADVHVFNAWPAFLNRFNAKSRSLETVRARTYTFDSLLPVVYQYGGLGLILAVMLVAATFGSGDEFGQFAASALLLLRSVQYGQQLQGSLQQLAKSIPRIELLEREVDVPTPRFTPGNRQLREVRHLQLNDVSYHYPGTDEPALRNVSLSLRPGHIVGVAGPSGSGKSTLAQILLRLRWPTGGSYVVNGHSADEYSPSSWNRLVSHVPQQPRLLHASLLDNVRFLDESISRQEAADAVVAVGLQEFVDSLPGGLDAELGPTSRSLSGGQVQRLGIARALARDPRFVILDEPTSALDAHAERVVGDALAALRGRTNMLVVVIAHRPSTLDLCDEVITLEHGEVFAAGQPDDDFLPTRS